MRHWSLAAPVVMMALAAAPAHAEDTIPDQVVVLNNQEAIDVPFAFGDVSVGSSEIVKVVPLREEKQLLLAGRTVGTTNVILYDTKGARRVTGCCATSASTLAAASRSAGPRSTTSAIQLKRPKRCGFASAPSAGSSRSESTSTRSSPKKISLRLCRRLNAQRSPHAERPDVNQSTNTRLAPDCSRNSCRCT